MQEESLTKATNEIREESKGHMVTDEISEIENRSAEYCELLLNSEEMPETDRETLFRAVSREVADLRRTEEEYKASYRRVRAAREEMDTHYREIHKNKRNLIYRWVPANLEVEYEEKKKNHFMQGINFYKLAYICFLGSFLGVAFEMIYCLLSEGVIYSRAGLVYGPFNFLYGIGAVALSVALYPIRHQRGIIAFFLGMVVGSAVEYACSFLQESLFGSTSWDYSDQFLNINGRICLFYSVIWGFLGYFWIKVLYPAIAQLFLKIPSKLGKIFAWVMIGFLCVNGIVTSIALTRWEARSRGEPPSNGFWEFIDSRFTDERMQSIFVKLEFSDNE